MKRMSEVFKLPVSTSLMGAEHAGEIVGSGKSHYCLEDSDYWMASSYEHVEAAAHAINNVDALADALSACAKVLGEMLESDQIGDGDRAYYQAIEALNAYRSTK